MINNIKPTTPELIIGIDPSSGAKSCVGICVIDARNRKILDIDEIAPLSKHYSVEKRIRLISLKIKEILEKYYFYENVLVATEYTVMKGKGGESLNRAIGAIIASLPIEKDGWEFKNIQNTSIKLLVAGSGNAEKDAVAHGSQRFFMQDLESIEIIKELTALEKFDTLDAIAIAITAYLQLHYNRDFIKNGPKTKEKYKVKSTR